jgi:hypothetical protein
LNRFIERIPQAFAALVCYLKTRMAPCSGISQLKNISQIEHSRHRSVVNYFADIETGLIAYTYRDKLPSLNLQPAEQMLLRDRSI